MEKNSLTTLPSRLCTLQPTTTRTTPRSAQRSASEKITYLKSKTSLVPGGGVGCGVVIETHFSVQAYQKYFF